MSQKAPRSNAKAALLLGVGLLVCVLIALVFLRAKRAPDGEPPLAESDRHLELGPPPALPFSPDAPVDLVPSRTAGLLGKIPISTAPSMWRGVVWQSAKGAGFGRHAPKAMYLLAGGAWMLVHAESGLWFVETGTLARRARLRTGALAAVDVTPGGDLLAYAECELPSDWGFRPDVSDKPCDLVVLRLPTLEEVRRASILAPTQIRFGSDAHAIAISRGHRGSAAVLPLDPTQPLWSCHVSSSSVAAVPIGEARVAYLTDGGQIVIEERDRREQLFLSSGDAPVIDFPIRIGIARGSGTLYYDASGDRVMEPRKSDALVIESASGPSPRLAQPIPWADFVASGVTKPRAVEVGVDELIQRFGLRSSFDWGLYGIRDLVFGPKGEALGLSAGYLVRMDRDGLARSPDFGPEEDRWNASLSPADMVLWLHGSDRTTLMRVPLGTPALDATPEAIGSFENHTEHQPLLFPGGDRAFLVTDEAKHTGLIRLPRGGKLSALEWLNVAAMYFADSAIRGENRYAFKNDEGVLVEIDSQRARVLDRGVAEGERLSWDAESKCWALETSMGKRLVGEGCH